MFFCLTENDALSQTEDSSDIVFLSITDFVGRHVSSLIYEIRDEHAPLIESSSLSLRVLVV